MKQISETVSLNLKRDFYDLGWCKVDNLFGNQELVRIEAEYANFVECEAPKLTGKDINYADKNNRIINSIHKLATEPGQYFWELLHSDYFLKLASLFLIDTATPRKAEMFAKPASIGMRSPIHQDNYYWCLKPYSIGTGLTMWIALDNCDSQNGGLTYLNASHRVGILAHESSFAPGSSQTIKNSAELMNNYNIVTPKLSPGDALIHDAHVVHFSEANVSGKSRRGMTFQYQSKSSTVDHEQLNIYEESLRKQLKDRNKDEPESL